MRNRGNKQKSNSKMTDLCISNYIKCKWSKYVKFSLSCYTNGSVLSFLSCVLYSFLIYLGDHSKK